MQVYRQCRVCFHFLAVNVASVDCDMKDTPAILMALSSERWPTFREMFPGIKDDDVDRYGLAATLRLPGKHIAMINRCLSNRDANFTEAAERFLGSNFWRCVVVGRVRCWSSMLPLQLSARQDASSA